jgi:hypothetical protein
MSETTHGFTNSSDNTSGNKDNCGTGSITFDVPLYFWQSRDDIEMGIPPLLPICAYSYSSIKVTLKNNKEREKEVPKHQGHRR